MTGPLSCPGPGTVLGAEDLLQGLQRGGGKGSLTGNCIVCVLRSCLGAQRRGFPAIHWGRVVTREAC